MDGSRRSWRDSNLLIRSRNRLWVPPRSAWTPGRRPSGVYAIWTGP